MVIQAIAQRHTRTLSILRMYMITILFLVGSSLFFLGISEYSKATRESFSLPKGTTILGENDTVIEDMKIILYKGYEVIHYEEGWVGVIVEFTSNCRDINLFFSLPCEVDYANAINYSDTSFFYFTSSYNESTDRSQVFLSYSSTEDENRVRISFDWKIFEQISFDQYKIGIAFENPYFDKPLFQELLPVYGKQGHVSWIPKIEKLMIQIRGTLPFDLSYTIPQPSRYYLRNDTSSAYWNFDSKVEVSSVQAVFVDPFLSKLKSDTIFSSGLYVAFGISTILWTLREIYLLILDACRQRTWNQEMK